MAIMKATPELERTQKSSTSHNKSHKTHHHHHHQSPKKQNLKSSPFFLYSPKVFIYFLIICVVLFILFNIQTLQLPPSSSFSTNSPSWPFIQQWQRLTIWNTTTTTDLTTISNKLRLSVTFLPLKDLRYSHIALEGHTWFMSSMYDTLHEGKVQYQQFPSESSHGRLLCIKGHDTHDGSWNYYALAWSETLPLNATLMKGLTFVSYNHYDYGNIWHGLSAVMPFVAWHKKNGCLELPSRWVLYHWGELRLNMGLWLENLMGATFDGEPYIEGFDGIDEETPVCFEKAVVMRHNEGGMSRENRMEVYDLMRCKARLYCNITSSATSNDHYKNNTIVMTLFMRTGPRSFKNETAVIGIFKTECAKVDGCLLKVVYSNNLTFCGQVKVMSMTDILISPHGAQLTNMFLMDRNSSVMEFFPKGWLKVAGVGQYVYHWIASWSGMKHQGAWRDPDGEHCPYAEDDRRCMSIYKNGRIGYNDTYFAEWAKNVLNEVKARKKEDHSVFINGGCTCN